MVETDPPRRAPTLIWWMLGLIVVLLFVAVVFMLRGHVVPAAVGPPAGTP